MRSTFENGSELSTRDRLIKSAVNEIHQKGYRKTQVEAITRAAGVSYRTFYIYFKNKNDLLVQVYKDLGLPFSNYIENPKTWVNSHHLDAFEKPIRHYFVETNPSSGLIRAFSQGLSQNDEILNLFLEELKMTASFFLIRAKSLKRKGLFLGSDENVLTNILAIAIIMPYYLMKMGVIHGDSDEMATSVSHLIFSVLKCKIKMTDKGVKASLKMNNTGKKIIAAAKKEFSKNGYSNASISDIVRVAGCSRAVFYNHFKNKDDLLRYLYRDFISPLNIVDDVFTDFSSGELTSSSENSLDYFIKMSGILYDIFDAMGDLKWAFLQGVYYSDTLGKDIQEFYGKLGRPLVNKLERLKAGGKFLNMNSATAADVIFITMVYMAFMSTTNIIDGPKDEFANTMGKVIYAFFNFNP